MLRIGVLVSGRGSNLQAIIDAVERKELDAEVVIVISDKKDALALERARNHNIPAIHINPKSFASRNEYEEEIVKTLKGYNAELVCLAGYMRIVGSVLLEAYRWRMMNIHPALLPSFPGADAQKQALEYGVKISGATVHFVDEGADTGPIIIQASVPVMEDDTVETLSDRILTEEHKIYPRAIQLFAEGRLTIEGNKVKIK